MNCVVKSFRKCIDWENVLKHKKDAKMRKIAAPNAHEKFHQEQRRKSEPSESQASHMHVSPVPLSSPLGAAKERGPAAVPLSSVGSGIAEATERMLVVVWSRG